MLSILLPLDCQFGWWKNEINCRDIGRIFISILVYQDDDFFIYDFFVRFHLVCRISFRRFSVYTQGYYYTHWGDKLSGGKIQRRIKYHRH